MRVLVVEDEPELLSALAAALREEGYAVDEAADGLDTRARKVLRDGVEVVLTAREYAIVEVLALRRGQVVSRTDIYEHIFDENDDTLSNLLDVHVSNIRKKLGKDFISTRRGQGYVIDG